MYEKTPPSAAMRPCFLSAEAMPLTRNHSCAFWTSPLFSIKAFLQSIIPAPDICRSSLTVAAEMAAPSAAGAAAGAAGSATGAAAAGAAGSATGAAAAAAGAGSSLAAGAAA